MILFITLYHPYKMAKNIHLYAYEYKEFADITNYTHNLTLTTGIPIQTHTHSLFLSLAHIFFSFFVKWMAHKPTELWRPWIPSITFFPGSTCHTYHTEYWQAMWLPQEHHSTYNITNSNGMNSSGSIKLAMIIIRDLCMPMCQGFQTMNGTQMNHRTHTHTHIISYMWQLRKPLEIYLHAHSFFQFFY